VDDEESVRIILGLLVKRAGGEPVLVSNAAAARDHARTDPVPPWLAIVDKNLPDGSGVELVRWLREACPTTDLMMVTGFANLESAVESLRLGVFDYIIKPFDSAWVVRRIELALEQRRLRLALAQTESDLRRAQLETLDVAGRAAEMLEPHAAGHARRVSLMTGILARALDGTESWVTDLAHAAMLHDLGYVGVPQPILAKPGPLTESERAAIRAHVTIGGQILAGTTSATLAMAREVVLTHHERWDGSGYPFGLRGEEIALGGRVVGVLDVFDAMLSSRPYREAFREDKVLAHVRAGAGSLFDPTVVEAFFDCLPRLKALAPGT
jgi:putative two-component system response regulator